jgi:hypothetical protein
MNEKSSLPLLGTVDKVIPPLSPHGPSKIHIGIETPIIFIGKLAARTY